MSTTSNRLFLAWAAKHKEAIQIEVDLSRLPPEAAGAQEDRLQAVRGEAQALLAQAQAAFQQELVARGLR